MANITQIKVNGTTYSLVDSKSARCIDESNVITNLTSGTTISWTATQDCWVTLAGYEVLGNTITLNDVALFALDGNRSSGRHGYGPFFIRKGDTIKIQVYNAGPTHGLKAFGLK